VLKHLHRVQEHQELLKQHPVLELESEVVEELVQQEQLEQDSESAHLGLQHLIHSIS
jgi:hypothetical protein